MLLLLSFQISTFTSTLHQAATTTYSSNTADSSSRSNYQYSKQISATLTLFRCLWQVVLFFIYFTFFFENITAFLPLNPTKGFLTFLIFLLIKKIKKHTNRGPPRVGEARKHCKNYTTHVSYSATLTDRFFQNRGPLFRDAQK